MNGTDSKNPYSYINDLGTEELETLLRAEALSTEDGDPDLMDYILEVIVKREKDGPSGGLPDVKKARQEFDELYRGLTEPLYDSSPMEEETPDAKEEAGTTSSKSTVRTGKLRRVLLVAAVVILAVAITAVPVFGYPNVIQMVAHLANGTFRFMPDGSVLGNSRSQSTVQPDSTYETLPEALEAYGIHEQVFPRVLAEEFEQTELKVYEYDISNKVVVIAYYENENKEIKFSVSKWFSLDSQKYEANQEDVEIHSVNGIDHYIFVNIDRITVIWYSGTLECSINGNFSVDDAKTLIDSIY